MSKVISKDVLNNIANALEKSSFGSGEMIAGRLMDPEFQMPVEPGVWDIKLVEEEDDYYYHYWKRKDNHVGSPTWKTMVSFHIKIDNNTIKFVLGCGVHGASCTFDKKTGDLIKVVPDSLPSNSFWGDGDRPNLARRARREFLQMTRR